MPAKKRARAYDNKVVNSIPKRNKRYSSTEFYESQDVWKNLERIRTYNRQSTLPIKNSKLFILLPKTIDLNEVHSCIETLHEYIEPDKLQLHSNKESVTPIYLLLQNFNILDCCLILSTLFAFKNKKWVFPFNREFFTIPVEIDLSGSFYLPNNCTRISPKFGSREESRIKITESELKTLRNFKEVYIHSAIENSLTHFIEDVATFFSEIKFGKTIKQGSISKQFEKDSKQYSYGINLSIGELPFNIEDLMDVGDISNANSKIIEKSKANLIKYLNDLRDYNETAEKLNVQKIVNTPEPVKQQQQATSAVDRTTPGSRYGSGTFTQNRNVTPSGDNTRYGSAHAQSDQSNRPHFMTQEEIKEHCIATIKASIDVVKAKSPYQILKTYIKCPRQNYIDILYQNLNDLRSQTNCNIVVLNLNNLHESTQWFTSLDVSKYTTFQQQPHQTTVRVVSIGGIGEHILKALELINNILNS